MEIRVEERLTGEQYMAKLLAEYGGIEQIKAAASEGKVEAKSDLADLELLVEDGRRLLLEFKVSTISTLEARDLERLTPERLKLLAAISGTRSPTKMGLLVEHLGRDKKNVSRDVKVLRQLGLVRSHRQGRETLVQSRGNEIHISLG